MVPAFHYSLYLTLYKTDISLRRTLTAGPKGVLLRGSWLYTDPKKLIVNKENKIIRCIVTHVDCRYFHGNQISKIIGGYGLYVLKKDYLSYR